MLIFAAMADRRHCFNEPIGCRLIAKIAEKPPFPHKNHRFHIKRYDRYYYDAIYAYVFLSKVKSRPAFTRMISLQQLMEIKTQYPMVAKQGFFLHLANFMIVFVCRGCLSDWLQQGRRCMA